MNTKRFLSELLDDSVRVPEPTLDTFQRRSLQMQRTHLVVALVRLVVAIFAIILSVIALL